MTELREAVICSPLRTPVGRFNGALAPLSALDLATRILSALIEPVLAPRAAKSNFRSVLRYAEKYAGVAA